MICIRSGIACHSCRNGCCKSPHDEPEYCHVDNTMRKKTRRNQLIVSLRVGLLPALYQICCYKLLSSKRRRSFYFFFTTNFHGNIACSVFGIISDSNWVQDGCIGATSDRQKGRTASWIVSSSTPYIHKIELHALKVFEEPQGNLYSSAQKIRDGMSLPSSLSAAAQSLQLLSARVQPVRRLAISDT